LFDVNDIKVDFRDHSLTGESGDGVEIWA